MSLKIYAYDKMNNSFRQIFLTIWIAALCFYASRRERQERQEFAHGWTVPAGFPDWIAPWVHSRNKALIQLCPTPTAICEIFFIFLMQHWG
jgi:hypothetical protein